MEFKEIIDRIDSLSDKTDSEENLKCHITVWMLQKLGYTLKDFDYEHRLCRGSEKNRHADIFIPIRNGNAMFVETKKYTKDLSIDDVYQLSEYISMHNEIAWGILTNGRQIYLINNSVDIYSDESKDLLSKVVLNIEYNPSTQKITNGEYLNYLSKSYIYDIHVTYYFKAVSQFFAKHRISNNSKNRYRNTLFQFFDYYVSKGNEYILYSSREYAPLERIRDDDVIDFLKNFKSKTRQASGTSPLTKCSHIATMYKVMESTGFISYNPMKELRKRVEVEFESIEQLGDPKTILNTESINIVLRKNNNKPHRIVIFTLAAYYGWSLDKIKKFMSQSWESIHFDKHIFKLDGKSYPMVKILEQALISLKNKYKQQGIKKPSAVYIVKKNGNIETPINKLFKDIKQYTEPNVDWSLFKTQNMRASAIYNMLCAGCSIEEISYITDSPVSQILKYLPDEIVQKNGFKKWNLKSGGIGKHPFKEIFDVSSNETSNEY